MGNSKTTFVTVNPGEALPGAIGFGDSKTTFVTVNRGNGN